MNIRPASNNQFKEWKKLLMGKYRKKHRLFLAEGPRGVEQILENGLIVVKELIIRNGDEACIPSRTKHAVYSLQPNEFNLLADTETPQGILAVCRQPDEATVSELSGKEGVIVAFDAVQDPGNLGTMVRTSSWFGASGIIAGTGTADLFHPKVVRSTAGATGSIPFVKGNLNEIFADLEQNGWPVYLLDGSDESANIATIHLAEKAVLVVGNEGNGVDSSLFASNRHPVKIPGQNRYVESLNAAVALSIGLYHFCK